MINENPEITELDCNPTFVYEKGKAISGLERISAEGTAVFHAGTRWEDGKLVTSGGRVLAVTTYDKTLENYFKDILLTS